MNEKREETIRWTIGIVIALILIILIFYGLPKYNVYRQKMAGEAQLAHAQSSKEVAVAEAKAKMESAALLAQADTIRAHGIATSNQIIGQSLKNNKAYLQWLWIDNIKDNENVIYIPTEANMPLLEAGRGTKGNTIQSKKIAEQTPEEYPEDPAEHP